MSTQEILSARRAEAEEILEEAWNLGIPGTIRRLIQQRIARYDKEINRLLDEEGATSSPPTS